MVNVKISDDINDFEHVYEDMKLQFPPCELKPYEQFVQLFKSGIYKLFLCEYGYMLFVAEEETNMLWLDYFAVFKQFHSRGLGSKLLKNIAEELKEYKGCYLEVEKADEKEPDTIRRINFYERAGAVNLDVDYLYPCIENPPLPMELYFLPFRNTVFKKPDNKTILLSVKNVFHILHKDVPNLRDVLHQIACRDQFPQAEQSHQPQ